MNNEKTIEEIKRAGAIKALKDTIGSLVFAITNRNFESVSNSGKYVRLGEAIGDARIKLTLAMECLDELNELDPGHK